MCECAGGECHYSDTDYQTLVTKIDHLTIRVEGIAQFFDMMAQHPLVKSMAAAQEPKIGFLARRQRGDA